MNCTHYCSRIQLENTVLCYTVQKSGVETLETFPNGLLYGGGCYLTATQGAAKFDLLEVIRT